MKEQTSPEKRTPIVPAHFRASDAVARAQQLDARLPIALLPRLSEALSAPAGDLQVQLAFAAHPRTTGRVHGCIQGLLPLTCQRSLAVFEWPLEVQFDWILVRDEAEEERVLSEADPVMLDEGELRLREAIEDEVLLALPLIPLAPDTAAPSGRSALKATKPRDKTKAPGISHNVELDDSRPNPFAALKGQFPKN